MRLTKRLIVWSYRSRFTLYSSAGIEHESDPDTFTAWVYFGFFGLALSWSRDGWLYPTEATRSTALQMLAAAPDPQRQTPAFLDEWDRLEAMARK